MNNLSFIRHDEFMLQLIVFLMGSRECDRTVRYRQLAIVFLILIFAASLSRPQDNYEILE